VYDAVRIRYPNISLGTVYRNLLLFQQTGKVRALDVGDGVIHFDPVPTEHEHFVCRQCGKVIDLPVRDPEHAKAEAAAHFGGQITGYSAFYTGLCEDCLRAQKTINTTTS
jgi:Fur family peroxide stress response transcriptional regulator